MSRLHASPPCSFRLPIVAFRSARAIWTLAAILLGLLIPTSLANAQTLEGFDINPGPGHSSPVVPQFIGDRIVFIADDGTGRELWQSDGTPSGTSQILEINPTGNAFPSCCGLTRIGNLLYFGASDGVSGSELWISDGTAGGTASVSDINTGPGSSHPGGFTEFNGEVYFSTILGFYKTDGTPGGTVPVAPIFNGSDMEELNGKLFFQGLGFGPNDTGYNELYVSDGTAAGTGVLKDINATGGSIPQDFRTVGNQLFFSAEEPATGRELWVTDGTAAGTHLVKDIGPGAAGFGSFTHWFTAFNGLLYFAADDGSGQKLWKSDGTALGTVPVAALTEAGWPAVHNGYLYFAGNDGVTGVELWRTDGTVVELIEDARPGPSGISPNNLTSTGGLLYFAANNGSLGIEPWVSDGTSAGTYQITDLNPGTSSSFPTLFVEVDGRILFRADNGTSGRELWAYTPQSVADLEVAKTVDVGSARIGDPVQFTVTVTNNGPDDASGIEISDPEPVGFSFDVVTPSQGTYTAGVWTVGSLGVGESASLQIAATVLASGPLGTGTFVDLFADFSEPDAFGSRPIYAEFGPDGHLYVSARFLNSVVRYDGVTGAFIDTFVAPGLGGLIEPTGLAFGPTGDLYVVSKSNQVIRYDGATGALVGVFAQDPQLKNPRSDLVFGRDGLLYVADSRSGFPGAAAIVRFDGDSGAFVDVFAESSDFRFPIDMEFGSDGHLYVLGSSTDKVIRLDGATGAIIDTFVSGIPDLPNNIGAFGLTFGPDGHLYISTAYNNSVIRYDGNSGALVDVYASAVDYNDDPSDLLNEPGELLFGPDGELYVVNINSGVIRFDGLPTNRASVVGLDQTDDNVSNNTASIGIIPITNSPPAIGVDAESVEVDEGEVASNAGSLNDADGNSLTVSASIGTVVNSGNTAWSWSYATTDGPSQSQTVTITADDQNGGVAEVEFELVVNNVAPSVDAINVPIDPIAIDDQPVSVSADFSDPGGTNDAPYTCTVDYGDGSGASAGTVSALTCTGPDHIYALPGIYTVHVTVSDKDGGVGESTASTFLVIFDPDGGFVTGGGWIDSPPEACPDFCGGASGKANFGFVSKYKKGQSTPSGETEFNFKAGNLNFHSVSYDWLVIAGPQAKFKGDGTINGEGDYGFMLSAIDGKLTGGGEADKFRIRIWTNDEAEVVVYDNQFGVADDADASDEIEGGSIVIHDGKSASKGAVSDATSELPEEYALHQNYPNPFNPVTNIGFDLPEPGFVRIRVIDMLGREVARLANNEMKAGRHTVSFDAGALPSGVYLFRMDAGAFTTTRPMILLK